MREVHRRHEMDADRAVDELMSSQMEIETLERALPDLGERHRFYQDLRGYVTDLVECFDEKVCLSVMGSISLYLSSRGHAMTLITRQGSCFKTLYN